MVARSRRSSALRRAQSRKFVWARREFNEIATADGPNWYNLLDQFQTELGAQLLGATVMRLRGDLWFEPAVSSQATCCAAVMVTSDEDITDGVDDGPLTNQHNDWMSYQPIHFSTADPTLQVFRWNVDVKSNRRMEELGQGLGLVFENSLAATTVAIDGVVSIGLKLP